MPDDPRTDAELVAAANAGDADAFGLLYQRHREWVVNLAFRFTNDRDAALDALQDTFFYWLKKFPGFELRAKVKTFLYPVVRNLALRAREKSRREELAGDDLEDIAGGVEPETSDPHSDLAAIMTGLPSGQREVLLLRFVDDLSLAEIAELLDSPLGTVKSRLHNGLRALAKNPGTKKYFE